MFPLGTHAKAEAAKRARQIYRTVAAEGWDNILRHHPREFTLAVFWAEDPMVFTYTTLYTIPGGVASPIAKCAPSERSVALVEPDPCCRAALARWIAGLPGYSCQGLFGDGRTALEALQRQAVDLVLFDRQLPDLPPGELCRSLQSFGPNMAAFGFRVYRHSDELFISQPGKPGGYFFRRRAPSQLLEPIEGLRCKARIRPADYQTSVFGYVSNLFRFPPRPDDRREPSLLTERELDILNYLAQGKSDKGIAGALRISAWTVHTHLKKIYEKLSVHSRTEAIIKYLQK